MSFMDDDGLALSIPYVGDVVLTVADWCWVVVSATILGAALVIGVVGSKFLAVCSAGLAAGVVLNVVYSGQRRARYRREQQTLQTMRDRVDEYTDQRYGFDPQRYMDP